MLKSSFSSVVFLNSHHHQKNFLCDNANKQKLYHLFWINFSNKCTNNKTKQSEALTFNQILVLCKEDRFCKDITINILLFIRRFLDYSKESKEAFELIEKCINVNLLITKLFDTIMNRYNPLNNKWSNTQQLIFLWTIYECKESDNHLHKLLKWTESVFFWNDLFLVFNKKGMQSFADFTNELYKYNMLTTLLEDNEKHDYDEDDDDDDDDYDNDTDTDFEIGDDKEEEELDEDMLGLMNVDDRGKIINNINDIADEDLFIVDDLDEDENEYEENGDENERNNKRLRDEIDDDGASFLNDWDQPKKKQKIDAQ